MLTKGPGAKKTAPQALLYIRNLPMETCAVRAKEGNAYIREKVKRGRQYVPRVGGG